MFELPSLPTDSLYKFLFLGGLILIIAAFTFSDRQYNTLVKDQNHKTLDSLEFEISKIKDSYNKKTNFLKLADTAAQQAGYRGEYIDRIYLFYKNRLKTDTLFATKYQLLIEANDKGDALFYKNRKTDLQVMIASLIRDEERKYIEDSDEVIEKRNIYLQLNKKVEDSLKVFNIYIYTAGGFGLFFSLLGITGWYLKLQKPQDQTVALQVELLKQNLKKEIINNRPAATAKIAGKLKKDGE